MKVSNAIEALKKLNPNEDIFITWFDKKEFEFEYDEWSDVTDEPLELNKDKWEGIVEGTQVDDRIADAIMESMRYDFAQIKKEQDELREQQETEQELWDIEGDVNVTTKKDD